MDEIEPHEGSPSEAGSQEAEGEYSPQYPVLQTLGKGRLGDTLLCQDPYQKSGKVVQKLINVDFSNKINDLVEVGFTDLGRLAHPNLALVQDVGWEETSAFLVSEYMPGSPFLEALAGQGLDKIIPVFYQLLGALDYLYANNCLHLNLGPDNIVLIPGPQPGSSILKLLDFGITPLFHSVLKGEEGTVPGKPPYTDPEFALHPGLDTRYDLYSVGVLLYQAISGKLPFKGSDPMALLQAQQKGNPKPLKKVAKQIPQELSDLVGQWMDPTIKNRPRSPRAAMESLSRIFGNHYLPPVELLPSPLSNPDQVFLSKEYIKLFRRIALQGRGWAFQGKRGSGKSFFAKWIQRYFWLNRKDVRFFRGEDISQIEGDFILNPKSPLYLIIDDADRGPVQAWLETHPYQHVIIFGEELSWAQGDPRWQFFPMNDFNPQIFKEALEMGLGTLGEESFRKISNQSKPYPSSIVQLSRDFNRQGLLVGNFSGWKLQEQKYLQPDSETRGVTVGSTLPRVSPNARRILSLLALTQVPLSRETIVGWLQIEPEGLGQYLRDLTREELLGRRVWMGQEFYEALIPVPARLEDSILDTDVEGWLEGLYQIGWYDEAVGALDRYFPPEVQAKNSNLVLQKARLLNGAGRHQQVFQCITSTFVKTLSGTPSGLAYEILGKSLVATEKFPQAEAAFKNAFNQYRGAEDVEGQARVLMESGSLALKTSDQSRALKFYGQSLSMADKLEDSQVLRGMIETRVGDLYFEATDYEKAEKHYQDAIGKIYHSSYRILLGEVYSRYARLSLETGEQNLAEYYGSEALKLSTFQREWNLQGRVFLLLADLEEQKGNQGKSLERLYEAVFAYAKTTNQRSYTEALIRRAYFLEANRRLDQAEEDSQNALQYAQKMNLPDLAGQAHLVLGKIRRRDIHQLVEAMKQFEMAREEFEKGQMLKWAWECEFEKGEIERNRGQEKAARPFYENSLKLLDRYVQTLTSQMKEKYLKDGKRDRVEMALKWLNE